MFEYDSTMKYSCNYFLHFFYSVNIDILTAVFNYETNVVHEFLFMYLYIQYWKVMHLYF